MTTHMTLLYPHSLETQQTHLTYFDLATGITLPVAAVAHTLFTDLSDSDRAAETGNNQYVEELQCSSCPDMSISVGCLSHVDAFGKKGVQYFCVTTDYCQRALKTARTR